MSKPTVLILGGCGFVGRNLIRYLVQTDSCSYIRSADKSRPDMAFFHPSDHKLFENPNVHYQMTNLTNQQSVQKAFTKEGGEFDYVINLASTAPYGEESYEEKLDRLVQICAGEAKNRKIKKWIEVSTGQVYKESSKASNESASLKPWTSLAVAKLKVESILKSIGIPLVILRPAIIYGPGDVTGLMPRFVIGTVYQELKETMELLWTGSLTINTVHVRDVCKAIWHVKDAADGTLFNLADKANTNQEKVNEVISKFFKIKTGFAGSMKSNFAKLNFKTVVESINSKHMEPWGTIMSKNDITRTPLSPFLEKELLYANNLSIDGTAIEKTNFVYDHPTPTEELYKEMLQYWIDQKAFPAL